MADEKYSVANPHPGFGKDPNIVNEFGHTKYPKYVTTPDKKRVIVKNKAEEDKVLGKAAEQTKQSEDNQTNQQQLQQTIPGNWGGPQGNQN